MKRLTERELEVVELLFNGLTNKEIGEKLYISYHTVKAVLENVYYKLSIHNRVTLAIKYYDWINKRKMINK